MKLTQLLLYIGIAILGFWLLGLLLKIAAWLAEIALVVGLILIIVALIGRYYDHHKAK